MCTARRQKEETSNLLNDHFGSLEATLLRVGVLIINLLLSIRSPKSYQVLMNVLLLISIVLLLCG